MIKLLTQQDLPLLVRFFLRPDVLLALPKGTETSGHYLEEFQKDTPFFKISAHIENNEIQTILVLSSLSHLFDMPEFLPIVCARWYHSVKYNSNIEQVSEEIIRAALGHFETLNYYQLYVVKQLTNGGNLKIKLRAIEKAFSFQPWAAHLDWYVETEDQKQTLPTVFKALTKFSRPPFVVLNLILTNEEREQRRKKHVPLLDEQKQV